jgi:hypothetical protein
MSDAVSRVTKPWIVTAPLGQEGAPASSTNYTNDVPLSDTKRPRLVRRGARHTMSDAFLMPAPTLRFRRILAIGEFHGCSSALRALLDKIADRITWHLAQQRVTMRLNPAGHSGLKPTRSVDPST